MRSGIFLSVVTPTEVFPSYAGVGFNINLVVPRRFEVRRVTIN